MTSVSNSASYDVIVIGAGSMGMSAGYHLAKRGVRTLLIDAFDPPHTEGSHHGEPRLMRHAYSGGPAYISLALRAHQLWNDAEQLTATKLLESSGVLNLMDVSTYSLRERVKDAERLGVSVEMVDADEIRKRWRGIVIPDRYEGMYEPTAGYLYSERCVAAYRKLAIDNGAELIVNSFVKGITTHRDSVSVHTNGGDYYASSVILSAGAWFESLTPYIELPIRPVRKVVGWFETSNDTFDAGRFPGFTLGTDNGGYYGFPNIGGAGLKIGRHDLGVPWHPGEIPAPFGAYAEDEGDLRSTLETFMPQAAGQLLRSAVCKYEMTPDEHFIIDRHPEHPHVLIAGGFSGHGFKFSSAVGELLSDLVVDGRTEQDLSMFSLSRFKPTYTSVSHPQ